MTQLSLMELLDKIIGLHFDDQVGLNINRYPLSSERKTSVR